MTSISIINLATDMLGRVVISYHYLNIERAFLFNVFQLPMGNYVLAYNINALTIAALIEIIN